MRYDCVIIGGGASGLMLAAQLNMTGRKGLILESGSRLGSKLLMSGGGHCNITHGGSIKDFIDAYGVAGRKLRRCLYSHNNLELIGWLEGGGISTIENEEGRVFPASMKAVDVLNFLASEVEKNNWEIRKNAKACSLRELSKKPGEVNGVRPGWEIGLNGGSELISCKCLVIAIGGITYPETGSDGSMFELLEAMDIEIVEPRPALAPILLVDYPYAELSGISIPGVSVSIHSQGGKPFRMQGDLLFTHEGLSGPVILNISGYASKGSLIRINYNKKIDELPKRMRKLIEDRSRGSSGDIRTSKLQSLLDADEFVVSEISPRGMVTRGGIGLSQIDCGTMQLTRPGSALFAVGEALDADGITGGYNLQLCYSTAACAAAAISELLTTE